MLRPGRAKWKWRMGNIKEIQDHEHTISEESREEMEMGRPDGNTKNEIDYIMTD